MSEPLAVELTAHPDRNTITFDANGNSKELTLDEAIAASDDFREVAEDDSVGEVQREFAQVVAGRLLFHVMEIREHSTDADKQVYQDE